MSPKWQGYWHGQWFIVQLAVSLWRHCEDYGPRECVDVHVYWREKEAWIKQSVTKGCVVVSLILLTYFSYLKSVLAVNCWWLTTQGHTSHTTPYCFANISPNQNTHVGIQNSHCLHRISILSQSYCHIITQLCPIYQGSHLCFS